MKCKISTGLLLTLMAQSSLAATLQSLEHSPLSTLAPYLSAKNAALTTRFKEINKGQDQRNVTHIRLQQTYLGYPVWDATAIVHLASGTKTINAALALQPQQSSMSGMIYTNLDKDLAGMSLNDADGEQALKVLKDTFAKRIGRTSLSSHEEVATGMIYVDRKEIAHYAFYTSFYFDDGISGAHRPTAIIDAKTFEVYRIWDRVLTMDSLPDGTTPVMGEGIGGNKNIGDVIYDGVRDHRPNLSMAKYDRLIKINNKELLISYCFLANESVVIDDFAYDQIAVSYCDPVKGDGTYWLSTYPSRYWTEDAMNGGRSPSLDALYGGTVIQNLYKDWYNIPALVTPNGEPMKLLMRVHYGRRYENAFWNGENMTFGDGGKTFYPLTSLDVTAHEVSHGFTEQHANLDYSMLQPAVLHEAFSDMAAKAAEFYLKGSNGWALGEDIFKAKGYAIRYLDEPTKDGYSIDHVKDFLDDGSYPNNPFIDPHRYAGIFNKAFYLIATSEGWTTRKAFDVMVQANRFYWPPSVNFVEAACGVEKAAKDLQYNTESVRAAFAKVGIDTSAC